MCARTRSRFRAFVHFFVFYVWDERQFAVKDNAQDLVSSTTGTRVPFSRRVGSEWGLRNLQKCMHTILEYRT